MGITLARLGVRGLVTAAIAAWALVVGACTNLPDARPFAEATIDLERSVIAGIEASADAQEVMASLAEVPDGHQNKAALDARRDSYRALAASIRQDAANRGALVRAMTDYADAVASVIEAADGAYGNVDAMADSLVNLASALTVTPLSPVANGAIKLGQIGVREAIAIKASRDLRKALEQADPVVQAAAAVLAADIADLRKSVATKNQAIDAMTSVVGGDAYQMRKRLIVKLEQRRLERLTAIDRLAPDVDVDTHPASGDLLVVESQLAAARAAVAAVERRGADAKRTIAMCEELFTKLEEAVNAWAQAHADLTAAAAQGREVNLRRVVEVVFEARGVIQEMSDAKEAANAG